MMIKLLSVLALFLCGLVNGDLYLHNPRGSNDRLNENSANRKNANRLFDSQNNNRGGYNVGDLTDIAAGNDTSKQFHMGYFQSGAWGNKATGEGVSHLTLEWTNQHGCGGNEDHDPQKQNCNMVIQFMCEDDTSTTPEKYRMRNGVSTTTQDYNKPGNLNENKSQRDQRRTNQVKSDRGLHESWDFYNNCYLRERNGGLFTADQNLRRNNGLGYSSAIYTRQSPNGNRYGYECPEERDYFPYWHPTQWKDIAILAENETMCNHYKSGSFNTQPYGECVEKYPDGSRKLWSRWNNADDCSDNGGQWVLFHNYLEKAPDFDTEAECQHRTDGNSKFIWGVPYDAEDVEKKECLVALETPECYEAPWSRSNHLGNGRDGKALTYTWKIPYFPSNHKQRCVLRMRYNISTDDYDPYHTDSKYNKDKSPVQDNPEVEVGGPTPLKLALNTNQTGRIFQDRSHIFYLKPRPDGWSHKERLFNLNVRGKRGNIVQVYPAVEYDFTPNKLEVSSSDLVHIQWTGSNTHNNGAPAGDGQAGNDGEGTAGTDRNNVVQIRDLSENFPLPYEQTTMWDAEIKWIYHGKTGILSKDLALGFSSSGYYRCIKKTSCPEEEHEDYIAETKAKMNNLLNNAPASYEGAVLRFKSGTYHYMCTRNNNFTNRSQKGTLIVR